MGTVHADITLKNAGDVINAKRGSLPEQSVREIAVNAVVDTGAVTLVISEAIREELGLEIREISEATLANKDKVVCKIAEPVEIRWKRRSSVCLPWVLPGAEGVLLGAIPLEDMDLIVDPRNLELAGRHGEEPVGVFY